MKGSALSGARAGHQKSVCEFGMTHGQCRCPSKDKTVIRVTCDRPDDHRPMGYPEGFQPKHRADAPRGGS